MRGTESVIEACLANSVKKLIYTSSSNVVLGGGFVGTEDEIGYGG